MREREQQVARAIALGESIQMIARRLEHCPHPSELHFALLRTLRLFLLLLLALLLLLDYLLFLSLVLVLLTTFISHFITPFGLRRSVHSTILRKSDLLILYTIQT
jgi:hypothetical protein